MPDIEDTGRDGHPFAHIDFASDAGAWEAILPFCLNVRILPDVALKCPFNGTEGGPDAPATDADSSFHADPNDTTSKDNHHV